MKEFLSRTVTLISEIIILILAIVWFYNTKEIEPIIVGIIALTAILTSLFFRSKNSEVNPEDNSTSNPGAENNSSFKATRLKAKKTIDGKVKQKNGKIKLDKIESKEGGINFDIDQS